MTKAEELKTLEKIEKLIQSAGDDSYITMTFAGIVDICRSNITNDFGDAPVKDLEEARHRAEMLDDIAHKALGERDKLQEDFDDLAVAYREAVEAANAAHPYAREASKAARRDMDTLTDDADNVTVGNAFRTVKKADRAVRMTATVLDKAYTKPYVTIMNDGKKATA